MTWATQMAHPHMGDGLDPFQEMYLPGDIQDQQSIYSHGFAGSEDIHNIHIGHAPSLKRFASTYDDPYSDVVSTYDMPAQPDQADPETPSIDRDNKLLSFSSARFDFTLLDYTYRQTTMNVSAQLHGMFFLAESPFTAADAQLPPNELTCYRRNLFQITGEIIMPRNLRYILAETGEQIPIMSQELVIQAAESLEGNPVKIISVPWKTPANPASSAVEDKLEKEPAPLPLDMNLIHDPESEIVTFPFSWKRLQFRIATANNGRRKELQQHFVVKLKVMATLPTGGKVSICEVQSGAIIVRGRSPRNFQSRKDMPLNGGTSHARKARTPSGDAVKRQSDAPTSAPIQADFQPPVTIQEQYIETRPQPNLKLPNDWPNRSAQHTIENEVLPTQNVLNGGNVYAVSSPDKPQLRIPKPPPPRPIKLELVEDETPKTLSTSQTPPDPRSSKRLQISPRPPSFSLNTLNSPDESADLLYEYFPLSLSDWSEPVDAVYRPHVVHHIRTKLPADALDPSRNPRSKRMYVE